MSTAQPHPELPADEELVAYLDGELPPEASRELEARLATDAELRRRLQRLDEAWEALDALPHSTVDEDFARTTIEMVAVVAEHDVAEQAAVASRIRRRRFLLLAAVGMITAAVGFALGRGLQPDVNQSLLADLPVIAQVDLLTQFNDIDFLRRLRQVPLDDLANDEQSLQREVDRLQATGAPSWEDRQRWIEDLSSEEKAELAARSQRFAALLPAGQEQDRLRRLEREIAQADDAADLQRTMLAYGQWLAHRLPGQQAELRELSVDKRLERIVELIRREDRRAARQLSPAEIVRLRGEILAIAEERKPQLERTMRHRRRDAGDSPRWAGAWWITNLGLFDPDEKARHALRERLTSQLRPEARKQLESLPPGLRHWQLMQWVGDSLRPERGPDELERFFAGKLPNEQRERLLAMPMAEMEVELERLYVAEQLGLPDIERWGEGAEPGGVRPLPTETEQQPRTRDPGDSPTPSDERDRGPLVPNRDPGQP